MEEASVASGAFVVTPSLIASPALSLAFLSVQAQLTWAQHLSPGKREMLGFL